MNKILNFVEEKLEPPLNKMANQHHLNAVKNGMMVTVPLTIIGSLFLLVPNIPIDFIKSFIENFIYFKIQILGGCLLWDSNQILK